MRLLNTSNTQCDGIALRIWTGTNANTGGPLSQAGVVFQGSQTSHVQDLAVEEIIVCTAAVTTECSAGALSVGYQDLGEALNQLSDSETDDEWRIDDSVYVWACAMAAHLALGEIPAPKISSHGARSVVFNWSFDEKNRYMTVSKDAVSILVSSVGKIEKRCEYRISQLLSREMPLRFLAQASSEAPVSYEVMDTGVSSEQHRRIW